MRGLAAANMVNGTFAAYGLPCRVRRLASPAWSQWTNLSKVLRPFASPMVWSVMGALCMINVSIGGVEPCKPLAALGGLKA